MTAARAQILLSTFNGSHFLRQQIRSLQMQSESRWTLLVRDDGSIDDSIEILNDLIKSDSRITLLQDTQKNLGPTQSFAKLLQHAATDIPLFFCDQDDIWEPEKISEFLKIFDAHPQKKIVVHCDLSLISEAGKNLAPSFNSLLGYIGHDHSLPQLLAQNTIPGCALAMSAEFCRLLLPIPKAAQMHDWWTVLIAAALGEIYYLPQSLVQYRQHGAQASGGSGQASLANKLRRRMSKGDFGLGALIQKRFAQAAALARHLENLPTDTAVAQNHKDWILKLRQKPTLAVFHSCIEYGLRMQGLSRNLLLYAGILLHSKRIQNALTKF